MAASSGMDLNIKSTLPAKTGHKDIDKLFNRGMAFVKSQRYDKAADMFSVILKQKPDHFAAIEQLGKIALQLEDYERALLFFKALTEHVPTYHQAYGYAADTLTRMERYEEAIDFLKRVLIIKNDLLYPHVELSRCYMFIGQQDLSREHIEHALKLDYNSPDVLYSYLNYHYKFETEDDPHLQHVLSIVEKDRKKLGHIPLAALYTVLYKAYNEIGQYDQAMHYAELAGHVRLKDNPNDFQSTKKIFTAIKDYFSKDYLENNAPNNENSELPVFILAMPRTGTTLLENILNAHPEITGIEEDAHFTKLVQDHSTLPDYNGMPYPLRLGPLKGAPMGLKELGDEHLKYLRSRSKGAKRVVDKAIIHYTWAGLLYMVYPNARFIYLKRDPLSSALSCYTRNFIRNTHPYTNDLYDLGRTFRLHYEIMEHWKNVIPTPILEITYEDLVENTEATSKRVVDYLGLPWDDHCLEFHKRKKIVKTASAQQVRQPVYKSSLKTWEKYEKHLAPLVEGLGPYAPKDCLYIVEKYGEKPDPKATCA